MSDVTSFVSADSHVVEPADLFVSRIDAQFRDRAPRIDSRASGDWYIIDGLPPTPVGLEGAALEEKISSGTVESGRARRHADTRAGAWDPVARLADQDLDHVSAEVIYPGNFGCAFFNVPDPDYQRACMRVYNDWIEELCASAPERLLGAALLPIGGPMEWAVEEAKRAAERNLATVMLPATLDGDSYRSDEFVPLFAALEEIGLPISVHCGTSTGESTSATKMRRLGPAVTLVQEKFGTTMTALADLISSGVPQQFPGLRFVLVEGGIGWLASVLRSMDHWWEDHSHWMTPKLEEPPSTYFRRQFWATFEDDRAGLLTRDLIGVDRLMWGSDYPHTEGTFPNSAAQVEKDLSDLPESEARMILRDNATSLYKVGS